MYETVVATDEDGLIGIGNKLPWNIPEELQHFKSLTINNRIFMGGKTFDGIGKALPNRETIVFKRPYHERGSYKYNGYRYLEQKMKQSYINKGAKKVIQIECFKHELSKTKRNFVVGGKFVYEKLIQDAGILHLSIIKGKFKTGTKEDVFLNIDLEPWELVKEEDRGRYIYKKYVRGKNG